MKLDDIKKQDIHKVPEGYFDELPHIIQSRVVQQKSKHKALWIKSLQYALPVLLLTIVAIYWFSVDNQTANPTAEELLAEVSTEELINYLDGTDITTEEIVEHIDLESIDFEFEESDTQLLEGLDIDENIYYDLLEDYEITQDTL